MLYIHIKYYVFLMVCQNKLGEIIKKMQISTYRQTNCHHKKLKTDSNKSKTG